MMRYDKQEQMMRYDKQEQMMRICFRSARMSFPGGFTQAATFTIGGVL